MACELLVVACMWDLVPWPGIEPGSPALGAQSLSHWTTREVPPPSLKWDHITKCSLDLLKRFSEFVCVTIIHVSITYEAIHI